MYKESVFKRPMAGSGVQAPYGISAVWGFTLVELIVVVAIIGMTALMAVPTFMKMIDTASENLTKCTTEVYATLRTARIYAMTNHVQAGVAYRLSEDGTHFESMAMVVASKTAGAPSGAFEIMQGTGGFELFPIETGVSRSYDPTAVVMTPQVYDDTPSDPNLVTNDQFAANLGMKRIVLYIPDTGEKWGEVPSAVSPLPQYRPIYAHIFDATSALDVPQFGSVPMKERYELYTSLTQDVPEDERLINNAEIRHDTIELFRSTGRVKVAQ